MQINFHEEATSRLSASRAVEVDVLNFSLASLSNEFIVGVAVAAIVISALVASSMFRKVALAIAAGAVVLLYLQGGTAALIATSKLVETEIKATPDFSQGLVVGLAIAAVFLVGMRQRTN